MRASLAVEDYETTWVRAYEAAKRRWPWWLLGLLAALLAIIAFMFGRLTALYG